MLDFLKRLLDPKVQIFLVGLLTVLAGVCEFLLDSDFIKGYPAVVSIIVPISAVLMGALRVFKTVFLAPVKKFCKKVR